ncbi:ABC transporter ATP-binding protein [Candidatus Competibacter phosphatis]|uniref:ABC transporter ATP-binding protein n=1 Tax=Candidatus Competibacter phosphatis TaxID=221280 RepID=UPI0028A63511|nr:ABC transporter ATP-binding protein [Candidatus Competibacter phosphatis]
MSFDLHHGESLGVIGRNGAGKSTLLQLLAGILRPDQGTLINHGVRATLLSLQIGFVPYLSGRQNAILSGMLLGLAKQEVEEKMADIRAFSELGDFFDQPINAYSSGMKARLGFSVAFQLNPDVLLIDEVLGVGDAEFKAKSSQIMREKIRSDKTIVLVSHSPGTIRQLCDRAVWIDNGATRAEGETTEVLDRYEQFLKRKGKAD